MSHFLFIIALCVFVYDKLHTSHIWLTERKILGSIVTFWLELSHRQCQDSEQYRQSIVVSFIYPLYVNKLVSHYDRNTLSLHVLSFQLSILKITYNILGINTFLKPPYWQILPKAKLSNCIWSKLSYNLYLMSVLLNKYLAHECSISVKTVLNLQ